MITLRPSQKEELPQFVAFESEDDTNEFIKAYSLVKHKECFDDKKTHYLSIIEIDRLIGFFLLHIEKNSVEFRRVVITKSARGFGQEAIQMMHSYCLGVFGRNKIWLDVFEHNKRGQHVYSKLGYNIIGNKEYEGKNLLIMEKHIQPNTTAEVTGARED
ncbi:MAG: GNAT family N-acetyltransferase [Nitrospinae bacterium]|nr:GNAT family N-acetyltransferase [Nitrospinota bacterium]